MQKTKNDVLPDKTRVMEQSHHWRKSIKHQHPQKTAAAKKSFKIMKQWNNDEGPTPLPSDDDDGLVVIEGESYIRKGGFTDDDDEIEPSQMDKITT